MAMSLFVQTIGPDPHILPHLRLGQPRVIKLIEPDAGWVQQIRQASPDTLIIGRLVRDHQNSLNTRAGRLFAREVIARAEQTQIIHWEGSNEAAKGDLDSVKRLTEFELAFAEETARVGLRPLVGGFSTGTPEIVGPDDAISMSTWEAFLPALRPAWGCHFHEYWNPWHLEDDWNAYRYLKWYPRLPDWARNDKWWLVSELGIDGGLVDQPRSGWQAFVSPSTYLDLLSKYNDALARFPRIVATIFHAGLGPDPSWSSFDIAGSPIMDHLARAWRAYPSQWGADQPPAPQRRRINIANDIPSHPTRRYDLRRLQDIDTIIIHHSGSQPAADYLAHTRAIARYHVSSDQLAAGGAPGIAYHRVITPTGVTYLTQPLEAITWHAGSPFWNQHSIAICLLGNFQSHHPTDEAINALRDEILILANALPAIPDIRFHSDVRDTVCPGKFLIERRPEFLPPQQSDYDRGWNDCLAHIQKSLEDLRR